QAFLSMQITITDFLIRSFQSISPGLVNTNLSAGHSEEIKKDFYEKVPTIQPKDVADALIYALGTRPEVQITELTIQHTWELP
ncbi:PREDICTED: dehydrogenase/reductase SDR family member 11-like, partial [Vollenhovia emeryi]|uniref:dehydrogenase/reductase SDR family member 11-like n=1 Tax=Vollenhovia emeryi TaxID=411798 RepID=UPI0005F4BB2C